MGYQASPADGDHAMHAHAIHMGRFSLDPLLRLIDAAIASLQRLRHRIEEPGDAESDRNRKKVGYEEHVEAAAGKAPRASRVRRLAVAALALSCVAALGTAFSYKLLSKSLSTSQAVAEALRDEIAELEKDGARLLQEKSKYQKQVYEHEKEIRALQHEADEARAEAEELRSQMKSARGSPPAQTAAVTAAAPGKRPVPQKTGTCITGGANAAANLARCVDEFNRK